MKQSNRVSKRIKKQMSDFINKERQSCDKRLERYIHQKVKISDNPNFVTGVSTNGGK